MIIAFARSHRRALWQIAFLLTGTSWLAAPLLNHTLSARTTLISQYEITAQPYSWMFRLGDLVAAVLLFWAAWHLSRHAPKPYRLFYPCIMLISILLLIDPLVTATNYCVGQHCPVPHSPGDIAHGASTILLTCLIFCVSAYDALKRRTLPSIFFLIFQIAYGGLLLSDIALTLAIATPSQYTHQLAIIIWLAWLLGATNNLVTRPKARQHVRQWFAAWAYLNGTFTIIISLAHIRLFGLLRSVYFAGDTAWVAQHGELIGVAMIYVSWHLWRGEHRARQLFLVLLGMEIFKYAVITPEILLLAVYSITFAILFAARPYFTRGTVALSWQARLQEAAGVLAGVCTASGVILVWLTHSPRYARIAQTAIEQFIGFVISYQYNPRSLLPSSLLAHTATALICGTLFFVLWSLFRPAPHATTRPSSDEQDTVRTLLQQHATSSEDYFKIWPADKQYYWSDDRTTCIAFTVTKSVAFALADPLGSQSQHQQLVRQFVASWAARGYRTCFIMAPESSREIYRAAGLTTLQLGSHAVVDIQAFVTTTAKNKWWRWQQNRGTKAGYHYAYSQPPHSDALLRQLHEVSDTWLARPGRREQGFALGNYSRQYMQDCVVHYLSNDDGHIVAFVNEVPVFNDLRQTTVDLMRFLPDDHGAMPYLLCCLLQNLARQHHYTHFDLGFVPLAHTKGKLATIARLASSQRFSAAGLAQFKNKFEPVWHQDFIAYDGDLADLAIIALNAEDAMKPNSTP